MKVDALVENGKVEVLAPLPDSWSDGTRLSVEEAEPPPNFKSEFRALAEKWKRETRYRSFTNQIALHPAYQRIIGMGFDGLPLILRELQNGPHHWFWALRSITGDDPVAEEDRGNMQAMTDAWLTWGRERGLVS